MRSYLAASALSLICLIQPASAAVYTYAFEASDFTASDNTPPPATSLSGFVTLTIDEALESAGPVDALSLTLAGTPLTTAAFVYSPDGFLFVGNQCTATDCSAGSGVDEFFLVLTFATGPANATFDSLTYGTSGTPGVWDSFTGSVTTTVTPIPAAAPLLLSAVAGLAVLRRRQT